VYEGLDVTTNKVTAGERGLVPHHLLGTVPALGEYKVTDFRDDALRAVCCISAKLHYEELLKSQVLP
jgi:tRNA A37 N6-isopentenylltransferase MiaA